MAERRQTARFALAVPMDAHIGVLQDVLIEHAGEDEIFVISPTPGVRGEELTLRIGPSDSVQMTMTVRTLQSEPILSDTRLRYRVRLAISGAIALSNGVVEAVTNPAVATLYPNDKVRYLNMLHAGWPGGLVFGGLLFLALGGLDWQWKIGIFLLPAVVYGVMMMGCKKGDDYQCHFVKGSEMAYYRMSKIGDTLKAGVSSPAPYNKRRSSV